MGYFVCRSVTQDTVNSLSTLHATQSSRRISAVRHTLGLSIALNTADVSIEKTYMTQNLHGERMKEYKSH